jgi:hypothetical protein
MAALASAIKASNEPESESEVIATASVEETSGIEALASRVENLEKTNRELEAKATEAEFMAQAARRETTLKESGLPQEMLERHLTRCFRMTEDQFNEYVDLVVDTMNSVILKTQASATAEAEVTEETTETAEGGDVADTEVKEQAEETSEVTETETAQVETETAEETVETEVEVEEPQSADEVVDEVEIDIEAVDPEINVEGEGNAGEPSLTDKMADIVQKFLQRKDNKWGELALK